jgi:hypothetical protein
MKNYKEEIKKYLNNDFLDTACLIKTDNPVVTLSYVSYETGNSYAEFKKKVIECIKVSVPKVYIESLEDKLSSLLFDKYISLANTNDKSVNKIIKRAKYSKIQNWIRNYVYGDNTMILSNNYEISIRRLLTKLNLTINNISLNTKLNLSNFIVISPKLIDIIFKSNKYFISEPYSKNNIIGRIGTLSDFDVYVNYNLKNSEILIGQKNREMQSGGVLIVENKIEIEDNINWIGAIDYSNIDIAKYMFDTINVEMERNLGWFKKLLNKYLKYKNRELR